MNDENRKSRRDFLKTCVAGTVALGASDVLSLAAPRAHVSTTSKSKVVIARDPMLRGNGGSVDSGRMLGLLDRAMQSFYGTADAMSSWKKLVRPGQVVGLKVNTIAGPGLSTNVTFAQAICERLQQSGIKPGNIIIWDRTNRELDHAGFRLSSDPNKVRVIGTDSSGYGYEDAHEKFGSVSCPLSKILTRTCDVVINLPLLKDHSGAGVTLSMKNMYGVIRNPNDCHANGCNPGVADVNSLPGIRSKVIFTIADLTTVGYEGGPGFRPDYAWKHNGVMVARDPVAIDYTGWRIIERKRAEKGLKTLEAAGRVPRYIATAADAQHRLGTDDPRSISVVEL